MDAVGGKNGADGGTDGRADEEEGFVKLVCIDGLKLKFSMPDEVGTGDDSAVDSGDEAVHSGVGGSGTDMPSGSGDSSVLLPIIGRRPSRSAFRISTALNLQ